MGKSSETLFGKIGLDIKFGYCRFKSVVSCEQHKKLLYSLLKQRRYNISHKELPKYADHCDFVQNHPYLLWCLVYSNEQLKGAVYVKHDNSIGLNLLDQKVEIVKSCVDFIKSHIVAGDRKPSVINPRFHINVPHENEELKSILRSLGMVSLQETFCDKE